MKVRIAVTRAAFNLFQGPSEMRNLPRQTPIVLALEPRIMFDGAMAADVVEVASEADAAQSEVDNENAEATATQPKQIIFVDESVRDYPSLIKSLQTDAEIFIIKSSENGLRQIADTLKERSDVASIHVFSHGGEGLLQLGDLIVTTSNLSENRDALAEIGRALSADGDILLYGCDVATDTGQGFITAISALTRADVAASEDLTGDSSQGGDWDLEASVGAIEADSLSAEAYQGILGTPVVANQTDAKIGILAPAEVIDADVSFLNGTDYTGGYVDFSLASITTSDTLALTSAADVNASGAISIVGSVVYQGTGVGREIIGAVDSTLDGTNGNNLRINLTAAITNTSFESNLDGWILTNAIYPTDLNGTAIDFVYTGAVPGGGAATGTGTISTAGASYASGTIARSTTQASDGSSSMELTVGGSVTGTGPTSQTDGNNSLHGTYATSNIFYANAGGTLAVDWRAIGGTDNYEVFGFLLGAGTDGIFDTGDDTNTTLFSQRGDTSSFATETSTFATTGLYKFQFLSGSYDASGGAAVGANLYIDNLVLTTTPPVINDTTISNLANLISFQNTETNPSDTPRTLTWSARANDGSIGSATSTITITDAVDPVARPPAPLVTDDGLIVREPVISVADDKTSDGLRTIVRNDGLGDAGRDGLQTVVRAGTQSTTADGGQDPVRGIEPPSAQITPGEASSFRPIVATAAAGGLPPGQFIGVMRGIADFSTASNGAVSFSVPADAFAVSSPNAVVQLSAVSADGAPLPSWLNFDATTGEFTGIAPARVQGEFDVSVFATDQDGNWVETRFKLFIGGEGATSEESAPADGNPQSAPVAPVGPDQEAPAERPNRSSSLAPAGSSPDAQAARFASTPGFTSQIAQKGHDGVAMRQATLVEIARLVTERMTTT